MMQLLHSLGVTAKRRDLVLPLAGFVLGAAAATAFFLSATRPAPAPAPPLPPLPQERPDPPDCRGLTADARAVCNLDHLLIH